MGVCGVIYTHFAFIDVDDGTVLKENRETLGFARTGRCQHGVVGLQNGKTLIVIRKYCEIELGGFRILAINYIK